MMENKIYHLKDGGEVEFDKLENLVWFPDEDYAYTAVNIEDWSFIETVLRQRFVHLHDGEFFAEVGQIPPLGDDEKAELAEFKRLIEKYNLDIGY